MNFKKTEDRKGYWAISDGNIDNYSAVNVTLDIKPVTVSITNGNKNKDFKASNFKVITRNINPSDIKGNLVIVGGAFGAKT